MGEIELPPEAALLRKADSRELGRRICDLSPELVSALSTGARETTTWTEWMAVDTAQLAYTVAGELPAGRLRERLNVVARDLTGKGILDRLNIVGRTIAGAMGDVGSPSFQHLATHSSDVVRQWCAYAVNYLWPPGSLEGPLMATLPFAADPHMSVRECAWMAFRPRLLARLEEGLRLLTEVAGSNEPRIRRFAVEVSRPRSVWGRHCAALKMDPTLGRPLLEVVRAESNRYTQLAVGNWLNDASKSRPDWVQAICNEWSCDGDQGTNWMVKRGLRTLRSRVAIDMKANPQATFHQFSTISSVGG